MISTYCQIVYLHDFTISCAHKDTDPDQIINMLTNKAMLTSI